MSIEQSRPNRPRCALIAIVALCALTASGYQKNKEVSRGIQSADKEIRLSAESRARIRQAIAAVGLLLVRNGGDDPEPRPRGSAVIVRGDGLIVTNSHVITDARSARLYDEIFFAQSSNAQPPGASNVYRLKPLLINRNYDLALLRAESYRDGRVLPQSAAFPAIEMGDSQSIELLEDLIIVGYPEKGGSTITLSTGFVEGKDPIKNWIKTDARVIHGNSGGAAVNSEGKLIGIPTKVEADVQPVDRDGDGAPDGFRRYGAVGFLRPAHLVAAMITELANPNARQRSDLPAANPSPPKPLTTKPQASGEVFVRGVVRSQTNGKPIAGAVVGIIPTGTAKVTEENLLAWGNTNITGQFSLNNSLPPGRYTLKATAIGHAPYSREVEINQDSPQIVIEMRSLLNQ